MKPEYAEAAFIIIEGSMVYALNIDFDFLVKMEADFEERGKRYLIRDNVDEYETVLKKRDYLLNLIPDNDTGYDFIVNNNRSIYDMEQDAQIIIEKLQTLGRKRRKKC